MKKLLVVIVFVLFLFILIADSGQTSGAKPHGVPSVETVIEISNKGKFNLIDKLLGR